MTRDNVSAPPGDRRLLAALASPPGSQPPCDELHICYVELLGPARLAAAVKSLQIVVNGPTAVGDLLRNMADACPALVGPVIDTQSRLVEGHILNRNGRDFLRDAGSDIVLPGDHLLLMSSSAGG